MLITNPEEFAHVAREWAVKYAGAQAYTDGQGSGDTSQSNPKQWEEKRKQREEAAKLAEYVSRDPRRQCLGD